MKKLYCEKCGDRLNTFFTETTVFYNCIQCGTAEAVPREDYTEWDLIIKTQKEKTE